MIRNATGNLLQADAEALVNTVNCDGFMGKGIALQFKQAWPENFDAYAKACRAKEVRPGQMFIWETSRMVNPRPHHASSAARRSQLRLGQDQGLQARAEPSERR